MTTTEQTDHFVPEDTIIHHTYVRCSWYDRLKVLLMGEIYFDVRIETEHTPGQVAGHERVWFPVWPWQRSQVSQMEVPRGEH